MLVIWEIKIQIRTFRKIGECNICVCVCACAVIIRHYPPYNKHKTSVGACTCAIHSQELLELFTGFQKLIKEAYDQLKSRCDLLAINNTWIFRTFCKNQFKHVSFV